MQEKAVILREGTKKFLLSKNYNYMFDTTTGLFARWGKTKEDKDDPKMAVFGPEILDLEISEVCHGTDKGPCSFCYKSNTPKGKVMSFETFKNIFDKFPKTLTQIAFGTGDIDSCTDMVKMFDYCRNNEHNPGVVPNITINGYRLTDDWVKTLAEKCGAVAVSLYHDKNVCYNAIERLTAAGMDQVNIHQLLSMETLERCHEAIDDIASDPRLAKMKAIVFLTLKPKGKRNTHNIVKDYNEYRKIVDHAIEKGVAIGFDSCSAPIFLRAMKGSDKFKEFATYAESCESSLFSSYVNTDGRYFHCSFTEGEHGWEGIDVTKVEDFLRDVWYAPETEKFRNKLMCQDNANISHDCRLCPIFDLYNEEIGNASDTKYIPIREIKAEARIERKVA